MGTCTDEWSTWSVIVVCLLGTPGSVLSVLGGKEALSSFLVHGCAQLAALCRNLTCTEI